MATRNNHVLRVELHSSLRAAQLVVWNDLLVC